MFAMTGRMNDKVTVSVTTSAERRKKKSATTTTRKKSKTPACPPKKKSAKRSTATAKKSARRSAPKKVSTARRQAPKKRAAVRSFRPAAPRAGGGLFHATGRVVASLLGRRSSLSDPDFVPYNRRAATHNIEVPDHVVKFLKGITSNSLYHLRVDTMLPYSFRWSDKNISWWAQVDPHWTAPFWLVISYFPDDDSITYCGYTRRDDSELNVIDFIESRDNDPLDIEGVKEEINSFVKELQENRESWQENEEDEDGLSDGLAGFDEKQISKIQDLNKKLASLDSVLGYKYRVYCAKNDEGYVLRRYAVSCEVGESAAWADDLSRFKPIGIGKVGRAKWFPKHHGVSWSFIKDNTKADIEKKVKAFLNKNDDAAEVVKEQKKAAVRSPRTKKAAAPKASAPKAESKPAAKSTSTKAARPVVRKEKPAPAAAQAAPAGAATEADLDSIEKSIDELAKLIQQSIK